MLACTTTSLSTAIIHWAAKSYVSEATLKGNVLSLNTFNILGKKRLSQYTLDKLKIPDTNNSRPFANLESTTVPKRYFYLHPELATPIFNAIRQAQQPKQLNKNDSK